jgi:hypothetical protein
MALVASVVLALAACQPSETELAGAPQEPAAAAEPAPGAAPTPAEPPPLSVEIPARFHGKWDASLEECGRASIMTLTVSGKELRFHESLGEIQTITPMGENAVMVSGPFEGEGESWQGEMKLELSADGDTLTATNNGTATPRVRCP